MIAWLRRRGWFDRRKRTELRLAHLERRQRRGSVEHETQRLHVLTDELEQTVRRRSNGG